jgi:hypothetical protein
MLARSIPSLLVVDWVYSDARHFLVLSVHQPLEGLRRVVEAAGEASGDGLVSLPAIDSSSTCCGGGPSIACVHVVVCCPYP